VKPRGLQGNLQPSLQDGRVRAGEQAVRRYA